jgi:hypothetical protein
MSRNRLSNSMPAASHAPLLNAENRVEIFSRSISSAKNIFISDTYDLVQTRL